MESTAIEPPSGPPLVQAPVPPRASDGANFVRVGAPLTVVVAVIVVVLAPMLWR